MSAAPKRKGRGAHVKRPRRRTHPRKASLRRKKAGKVIKLKPKPQRKAPTGTITGPCMDKGWQTPPELVKPVEDYFEEGRIPFDAATVPSNPCRAKRWFTKNGLTRPWPSKVWVNPPYGSDLRLWLPKMATESTKGSEIVTLLPCSRWEQYYFQFTLAHANLICLIRKRVRFIRPSTGERVSGNPYANMFLAFNGDQDRFVRAFGRVGMVLEVKTLFGPTPERLPT